MGGIGALGALLAGIGIAGQYNLRYAFAFSATMACVVMILTLIHTFSSVSD